MHMKYFGDSFDVVKMSMIHWLMPFGEWAVHPMLTDDASMEEVAAFEQFVGAKVISTEVLNRATNRNSYFSCVSQCGNLLLDPDTGLRLEIINGIRAPEFLFASELVNIISDRRSSLTVVFDKSIPRGSEHEAVKLKLAHLQSHGVHGFAYVSHACFIVASHDKELIKRALNRVSSLSHLPASRFLVGWNGDM
jgi:hypothetical protein